MPSVQSFDVFDTVLTRRVGDPRAVFEAAGRLLHAAGTIDLTPLAYRAVRDRAHADLVVRRREHVRLDEVVAEVVDRLALPVAQAQALVDAELAAERSLCRAVPGAPERLAAARAATGRGVVFVSDTPLSEEFLRELLTGLDLWQEGDRVFASGERAASKESGALYDLVAAELGLAPSDVLHVGDDLRHDVARARLSGWQSQHRPAASLTSHERRMETHAAATDGYASWLAGAARLGRLRATQDGVDPALAGIATGIGLPLLAGYALWVLRQVELQQLDTLWFSARDGEVVREVFLPLARQVGCDVRIEYVYGSRISWHVASTAATTAERDQEEWLYETDDRGTVREVFGRLGLTLEQVRALAPSPLFEPGRTDHHLSAAERAELRVLLTSGPLADELRSRAVRQRDLMLRYLDERGIGSAGRYAVVDVGWRGRTARSLEDVLRYGERPLPTAHLFLGLFEDTPERTGADVFPRCAAWLFDLARGRGVDLGTADIAKMVETFTHGLEGYTLGYQASDGDGPVQPRLVSPRNDHLLEWGLDGVRSALEHATAVLAEGPTPPAHLDLRTLAWDQLRTFWDQPSPSEAAVWSAQPWGEDWTGTVTAPVGPSVDWRRVAAELRQGRLSVRPTLTWYEGVALTSAQPWRGLLLGIKRTRRLLPRVRRLPDRLRAEAAVRRRV